MRMLIHLAAVLMLLELGLSEPQAPQRTSLDTVLGDFFRPVRLLGLALAGRTGEMPRNLQNLKSLKRTQVLAGPQQRQSFCDVNNGWGRRSIERPTSVHRLHPGDIDIIAGMGDSLTAGNGIYANNANQLFVENRGASFSIGGQGNWQEQMTLPNILKEFNPQLYGYSTRDGLASDRSSKFNVAEPAAMSQDMPHMAKVLLKRMQRDPHVNMTHHWKLITLFIGSNDFCLDLCTYPHPEDAVKRHEHNLLQTYRYLRDNVPNLMLNVVQPPDVTFLLRTKKLPAVCQNIMLPFECPCMYGLAARQRASRLAPVIRQWLAKDREIAERPEFNSETFTINYHTFTAFHDFFLDSSGGTDTRFLSVDCFHLSQRGHAMAANALWNNLLEPPEAKSQLDPQLMRVFRCPTAQHPYILTRMNSHASSTY